MDSVRGVGCCVEVRDTVRVHLQHELWHHDVLHLLTPFVVRERRSRSARWVDPTVEPSVSRDRERRSLGVVMPLVGRTVVRTEVSPDGALRMIDGDGDRELLVRADTEAPAWQVEGLGDGPWWCRAGGAGGFEIYVRDD